MLRYYHLGSDNEIEDRKIALTCPNVEKVRILIIMCLVVMVKKNMLACVTNVIICGIFMR